MTKATHILIVKVVLLSEIPCDARGLLLLLALHYFDHIFGGCVGFPPQNLCIFLLPLLVAPGSIIDFVHHGLHVIAETAVAGELAVGRSHTEAIDVLEAELVVLALSLDLLNLNLMQSIDQSGNLARGITRIEALDWVQ